ncbi:KTSC domain-containing protein [Phyllobacterium sp. K27]
MPIVKSSAIRRIEHNPASGTLSIWFVESGGPYDYYGVPGSVYLAFLAARSKGSFFNDYIRDRYSSNR